MNGAVEWEQIGYLLGTVGSIVGVWYRLQRQISANLSHHEMRLAEYQLHVAETYVTKAGLNEQTDRMMKAIDGLDSKFDRMNERLDKAFQQSSGRGS